MRRTLARASFSGMNSMYIPFIIRGTAILVLLFIIPLEYLLDDTLSNEEVHLIEYIQDLETSNLNTFFKGITATGTHYMVIALLPFLYNFMDSVIVIKISIVICHALYLYSFTAILFTEPRPYWIHKSIKGINCEDGFGLPSEEILFGMIFYFYIIVEVFESAHKQFKTLLYMLYTALLILLAFSDMYLGENFLHQIVLTLCLGFVYITGVLLLDTYISNLALMSTYYNNKNRTVQVYWFIACMAMLLVIITLSANVPSFDQPSIIWIKNSYKHCDFREDIGGSYSFYQSGWIFFNAGAIFGSQLASRKVAVGWWRSKLYLKLFKGIVSSAVGFGIYFGFAYVETYDRTTEYAFNYVIPVSVGSFVCFGVLPIIFEKLKLNGTGMNSVYDSAGISLRELP